MQEMIANRYRVLSALGQGNMGAVHRVADTLEGDREVALKVIQAPGTITPELRLLFKEEFRAMAKLRHPNTIEVFGYGQLDANAQYLTMEIVPGRELAEVIGGRPMPLAEVYPLLIQLLQALGFIHARLYVHHDIKSHNIRLKPDGTLKLMDFGLMCQLGRPAQGGRVTGTPGYLPPEIVKGGVINASTDLYSVGCLAFEMLTGQLPFSGKVGEVIRAHVQEPPPALRSRRPDAPEELARIVARLLEKDQTRRYQEASEVIQDLAALAGLQVARENLAQRSSYLTTSTLVAREAELAQLEAALAEATAGRGSALFVGAPAGVGKSRLVQELVLHAKLDNVLVAHGHCLEAGQEPYEPLRQAMRVLVPHATPEVRERFAPLLHKLVPEHFPEPDDCSHEEFTSKEEEKAAVLQAVTAFLKAITAQTPVLLILDDAHWGDLQSVELFNHLVRQAKDMRLLCLATLRSDETPPASPVWYTVEEGVARLLPVNPFDRDQLVQLVVAMLHRVELTPYCVNYLYGATAGNAFFLTELLRHLMEERVLLQADGVWRLQGGPDSFQPPRSVEETVLRRLNQLTPGARALARMASAFGRYIERDMLLHVSGVDPETLFVRLDELIERQFIVREETRYTFPHDRVWEALYADLGDEERRAIHQRCGEYLERAHAGDLSAHLQELARHFSLGSDAGKAFHYLEAAGQAALEAGAAGLAVERWLQAEPFLGAIALPNQQEVQLDLWWDICGHGFNILPAKAVEAAHKLIAAYEGPAASLPDAALERIKAYALLAVACGFCGQPTPGLEAADRALALLPSGDSPMRGALIMTKVANLFPAGRIDEVCALCEQAAPFLIGVDLEGQTPMVYNTRVGCASYPNTATFQGVRPDMRRAEYAMWAADEAKSHGLVNIILAFVAIWHAWTGRQPEAVGYVEETFQYCRKLDAPPYPWALYLRPYLLWQRGEFADAQQLVEQYLRFTHLDQIDLAKQLIVTLKGHIHLAMGELDQAEAAFRVAEQRGREAPMAVVTMRALLGRAEWAIARQDYPEARRALTEVLKSAQAGPARNPLHEALAEKLLGETALRERLYTRAREHLDRALAVFSRPEQDNVIEQAHTHRLLGEVVLGQGDRVAAGSAFRKAGELYHQLRNRHWLHAVNRHLETLHQQPTQPQAAEATPEERFEHLRGMLMR